MALIYTLPSLSLSLFLHHMSPFYLFNVVTLIMLDVQMPDNAFSYFEINLLTYGMVLAIILL